MARWVGLVGLLALAMRLWGLTRQALWIDEVFSLKYAQIDRSLTWDAVRSNLHGPLHAAFLHLWSSVFGWGELAVRLPGALFSAATVPMLFVVARPIFGDRCALAGSFLMAINPFHVWYAQEVRNYSFLVFFVLLATMALQRLDREGRPSEVVALSACWIAGLLSNLAMAFHMVGAGIWGLVRFRRRTPALRSLVLAGVVALVALLPWEVEFYKNRLSESHALSLDTVPEEERLRGDATAPLLGIPYSIYAFSVGFSLGPSQRELRLSHSMENLAPYGVPIAATALVFGVLGVAGLIRWIKGDEQRRLWLMLLVVPILLGFLSAMRNVKVLNARYLSVAMPAYLLLLADGAFALRKLRIGTILFCGVVLLSVVSLYQMQTTSRYWKADARSATRVLREQLGPGDLVFVVGTLDPVERYYWRDLVKHREIRRYGVPYLIGPENAKHRQEAQQAISTSDDTYVLFYHEYCHDPQGRWEEFLREQYRVTETWEFPGVRIWRLGEGRVP